MKRAIFAGCAVLLALALVTCDAFPPAVKDGEDSKPELVTLDNGLPGVYLTIKVADNAGRSMTTAHAKEWTNYYEVAFLDKKGNIWRAKWRGLESGRIAVPFGDYGDVDPSVNPGTPTTPGTPAAIMFAGRYETKSLLAVGKLTQVNTDVGITEINADTTSVTFTLIPLNADVKADPDSSFAITGPTGGYLDTQGQLTEDFRSNGYLPATSTTVVSASGNTITLDPDNSEFAMDQKIKLDDGTLVDEDLTVTNVEPTGFTWSGLATTGSSNAAGLFIVGSDPAFATNPITTATPSNEIQVDGQTYTVTGITGTGPFNIAVTPAPPDGLSSENIDVWKIGTTITVNSPVTVTGSSIDIYIWSIGTFPQFKYTVNGKISYIPLFLVDTDTTGSTVITTTAEYKITDPTGAGFPHNAGVFVQTPKLFTEAFMSREYPNIGYFAIDDSPGSGLSIEWDNGASGTVSEDYVICADGVFTIKIPIKPNQKGLRWFALDIPVRALDQDPDENGDEWHIRGGLLNAELDMGAEQLDNDPDHLPGGGTILLGTHNIEITSDFEIIGKF